MVVFTLDIAGTNLSIATKQEWFTALIERSCQVDKYISDDKLLLLTLKAEFSNLIRLDLCKGVILDSK